MESDKENEQSDVETWEEKVEETGEERGVTSDEMADAFWEQYLKGAAEDKAFNMAQHMKQYHPHGFTENSTCKYYPTLNKGNPHIHKGHDDKKEGRLPSQKASSLDEKKVKESLWKDFGALAIRAAKVQDLRDFGFASFDLNDFEKDGVPLPLEAHTYALQAFYGVCRDLKARFPNFQLAMPYLVPWDFSKIGGIGRSSADRRRPKKFIQKCQEYGVPREMQKNECYISLGNIKGISGTGPNYQATDGLENSIIRHEIGHHLATKKVLEKWVTYRRAIFDQFLKKERDVEESVKRTKEYVTQKISEGAARWDEEAIAEIFSIYTDPRYRKGSLDRPLEDIAETMLNQYKGKELKEILAFDSKGEKMEEKFHLPDWARRDFGYDKPVFPLVPRPKGIADLMWFDQWDGKWHVFSDYAEMMRYILDAYAFLPEDIERIAKAFPNIKWEPMILWDMRNEYVRGDKKTVEEIIEKFGFLKEGKEGKTFVVEDSAEEVKDIVIFDPEEFDQNSFEWGAIYWINTIRGEVEKFDEGYVIPDEQMIEMLAPLKAAARVYAEAQGQNKAWVKNTVLSVPKAFLNAFDVLSDGEGVTKERFLELFTVEAICALATGEVNSIHDIEEYYDRKGIYRPRGGYKVGDWVVIEKNAPGGKEDKRRDRDIRRVIALLGDEGNGDVELVFWNAKKTKPIARKASDCSEAFSSYEAASDYKWDDVTTPDEDAESRQKSEEDEVYEALYGAILESMGITQDAASEKGAAGFWEEHDRKHHHGHYDPETQTCTLREEARAAEERRSKTDAKIDDLTGGSGNAIISPNKTISKEEDYVRAQGNNLPRREGGEGVGREQPQGGGAHNILAESSAIARGVEGRVQESTRVRDKEAESAARLKEYAKENGLWRDDVEKEFDARYGTEEGQKNTDGGEAIVWFDRDRGVAVKAIGLDYYGSPALALDRVELHNRYFPHAPLSLVGFGEVKDVVGKNGEVELYGRPFNIIAEQPIIDRSKELTKGEIRERLEAQGFMFVADRGDSGIDMATPDGKAVVSDLHERNVFGTEGGGVAVIDCDIRRKGGLAGEDNPTKRNVGVTDEEEAEYLEAVLSGDETKTTQLIQRAAKLAGYEDVSEYKNTENTRKLLDPVTYDDKGRVIPLSKRFDDGDDIRGDVTSGIDIDKLREYKALMEKKKPGVDAMKALVKIGRMKAPEAMEKAFREMLGNSGTRHTYGVPYQGSKSRTAKSIVDRLPKGKRFVDLFSGGGAVTHAAMESRKYEKYRMNDLDGKGQRLFLEGVQGKWDDYARKSMTEEEFSAIKGTPESLPWSFNGLGRNLARPSNGRDHAAEQIRRVKALSSLKEQSNNIESSETDYSEVELKPGDVVYADIPYESTDQRGYGIGGGFDKAKFIKWAQRQRFPVYVSEYAMPEGWTEVASFDVRGMRGGGKKEKLFVQSKFARKVLTVQDSALYPNDPDSWMKHDRAHHHGHFDPNTQTCTLREQMGLPTAKNKTQRETQQAREDEQIDDLSETSPKANPPSSRTQAKINELANSIASFGGDMDPVKLATLISALPKASRIVKAAQKIKSLSSPKVRRVSAEEFHKAISAAVATRPESDRWRVDIHPIEDYKKDQCFVSDGGSVFALAGEDIVSVCKNRDDKGFSGKGLLAAAVLNGGRKLDSYEGNHAFYAKCGFEPVSWTKFNPEYAPDGALPEDIIFYIYTGNKRELDKAEVNKEIFDFKRSIEPMEYDAAGAYRDARLG